MVLDLTKYDYVHTHLLLEDYPELQNPDVKAVFDHLRPRIASDFKDLGFAEHYGITLRTKDVASLLKASPSLVDKLTNEGFLKSTSLNDGDRAKIFLTTMVIDYITMRAIKAEMQISYQRG